jgi:hypothetical protein
MAEAGPDASVLPSSRLYRIAGVKFCHCFGRKVVRPPSYVVWATPTHPSRSWAVGHEIRTGCLKVVAYPDSKLLADALAKRLGGD